jgi:hypothetical protein
MTSPTLAERGADEKTKSHEEGNGADQTGPISRRSSTFST